MSGKIIELDESSFGEVTASGLVVVDFYADWCGPCKQQEPIMESLASNIENVKVAKFDVGSSPEIAGGLGIRAIPAIFIFKDGDPVQKLVGIQSESELVRVIENLKKEE